MLHGGGTERIGGAQIDLLAGFLELVSQLTDRGRLTHPVHAYNHDHVGFLALRKRESLGILRIVLCQQASDLVTQQGGQFLGGDILVTGHTLLDTVDDFQRGIYTDIRGNQYFLQIIQHIVAHLTLTGDLLGNLGKNTLLRLRQTFIQGFLLVLTEKAKNTHIYFVSVFIYFKSHLSSSFRISLTDIDSISLLSYIVTR